MRVMNQIAMFLKMNGIKQVELARYLSISEPSVSKMVKGYTNPSPENLHKILNNDQGWDTSMLTSGIVNQSIGNGSSNNTQVVGTGDTAMLQEKIKFLEKMLEEKERTIQILMAKSQQ